MFMMLLAIVLFLSIISVAAVIMIKNSYKKWGYTEERERELEEGRHD